jgi:hypothetical protein
MSFPTTMTATQANKETPIGEMFANLKPFALGAQDHAASSGLTIGVHGGPMMVDGVLTVIADQTTLLAASSTSYVEWTRGGVLSDNTTGFTPGRIPLFVVTTSASGITAAVDWRVWQDLPGVSGRASVAVTVADVILSAAEARCDIVNVTGVLTDNRSLIVPNGPQQWCVTNNTTGAFTLTVKTAAGTGIAVTQGKSADLVADGTNVILGNNDAAAIGGSLLAANNLSDVASAPSARTSLELGTSAVLDVDTDGTLGANSDSKVPSQKAVKTAIATALVGVPDAFVVKGAIDCSANPNYPAAGAGDVYRVSVAGRIGGASGPKVTAGDTMTCYVDSTASGNEATVGANWTITQANIDGAATATTAPTNHGVVLGKGTQDLGSTAALTDGQLLVGQSGADPLPKTLSGDATLSAAGALTVANDAITYAKMQNVSATDKVLGRITAGSGDVEEISTTGSGNVVRATSPTLVTPALGTPASGNLSSCTADGTNAVGFRHIPQNSQSTAYTTVLTDAGKHLLHPSADTTARTFTIDSNANVAFPVGTAITFVNQASAGVMTIAITTDTMRLAGAGTTGSRTLAANGIATALKLTSNEWIISGTGLT